MNTIIYTDIEITCRNVIKDAVEENYESDNDSRLLNMRYLHDDVKQKTSLVSVQGKICLVLFHGFWSSILRHPSPGHEFIVNVKCRIPILHVLLCVAFVLDNAELEIRTCFV